MSSVLMSFANTLLLAVLSDSPVGTVCVAPNSAQRPTLISPGQDYNPATLSVRIDKGKLRPWPHREGMKIDDLDLGASHLVELLSDSKRIMSFWFRFSDYKSPDLCLSFDGYQGAQLEEGKKWCKCK